MLSNQVNGFHRKFFLSGPYIWINVRFYLSQAQAANFSINRLKKNSFIFIGHNLSCRYLNVLLTFYKDNIVIADETKKQFNSIWNFFPTFGLMIAFEHCQGITNNLFYCNWICFISYQIIQKTLKLNRENNLIKTLPRMSWWSHAK